ncbi:sulfatase-like hydrolase/transferase [Arenibacter echinorum]|uniref:Choline-sulfatase n=1 Tax=Arenibacter echinorum TaxID=440515 RepID=A0A327R035_9FLAO|nr:sulfatase-like hydrolase/transferase [Arenibacter echinorum]RAJ10236.1 choline-sulfatase [Arenibacter echinorum]
MKIKHLRLIVLIILGSNLYAQESKPNILIISADEMVPMLLGAYGHPVVKTPHLDQLAKQGVRFDAAYANNPLCAPARAVMLTGMYSSNIGVYDNAAPLASDIPTINHYLVNHGYETVLSGKVHFVGPDQLHGFQKRLIKSNYPADYEWVKSREEKIPRDHYKNYIASGVKIGKRNHSSDLDELAHGKAIEYLREKDGTQPFFLFVSYNFPHDPFWPSQKHWDMYKDAEIQMPEFPENWKDKLSIMEKWLRRHSGTDEVDVTVPESIREVRRAYYALYSYIDDKVGELLSALKDKGLDKNTIVVFTSDHGDMIGEKGMVQKRSFNEWSARVPLIVKYPDKSFAGTQQATPVSLVDIMPTMLDWAGIPKEHRLDYDGSSLVPLMDGKLDDNRFALIENHSEGVYTTCFSVVKSGYKYNWFRGYGAQLINLKADPGEWNNLNGQREHAGLEHDFRQLILDRFDPVQLEKDVRFSISSRMMIQSVLEKQGIDWRYNPDKEN